MSGKLFSKQMGVPNTGSPATDTVWTRSPGVRSTGTCWRALIHESSSAERARTRRTAPGAPCRSGQPIRPAPSKSRTFVRSRPSGSSVIAAHQGGHPHRGNGVVDRGASSPASVSASGIEGALAPHRQVRGVGGQLAVGRRRSSAPPRGPGPPDRWHSACRTSTCTAATRIDRPFGPPKRDQPRAEGRHDDHRAGHHAAPQAASADAPPPGAAVHHRHDERDAPDARHRGEPHGGPVVHLADPEVAPREAARTARARAASRSRSTGRRPARPR